MKFRFCGGNDCPEWILANISLISQLTVIQLKLTLNLIMRNLVRDNRLDIPALRKRSKNIETLADANALYATLIYIVKQSARFNLPGAVLAEELEQMGLSAILAKAIQRSFDKERDNLRQWLAKVQEMRYKRVDDLDWNVQHVISSSKLEEGMTLPSVQLDLRTTHSGDIEDNASSVQRNTDKFELSLKQFRLLHHDLSLIHQKMRQLSVSQ